MSCRLLLLSLISFPLMVVLPTRLEAEGLRFVNTPTRIQSQDARVQLVVHKSGERGSTIDVTRQVAFRVEPQDLVQVDSTGLMTPVRSGKGSVIASVPEMGEARLEIDIELPEVEPRVNFPNQVVPIFTKYGCNGGGCHGKLAGQNGFRLSLLGFEPKEDYEHLVLESRGRRLFPASPDSSLLLQKSVGSVPHGGGQRMDVDSHDYRLLRRWIAQAMPYGDEQDRKVASIEVLPPVSTLDRQSEQQLRVIANYVDGSQEDVTRTVQYESNNLEMADVSPSGLVRLRDMAGEVSVMARYQGKVSVFRASIPLGNTIEKWPVERNSVDRAVFAKLRTLGIPPSELCSDSAFLRRVTLDITGRLPTLEEIELSRSESREQIVDRLLQDDGYAFTFANKWSAILRNRHTTEETRYAAYAFHDWLVTSFRENKPFDRFVRELLTASGSPQTDPAVVWFRQVNSTESRIEDIAQLFLGQRLQCARCHHHPFEKWGQQDYYQMAAFFSKVEKRDGSAAQEPRFVSRVGDASMKHPKSGENLRPAGLDAAPVDLSSLDDPRHAFADWMVGANNPFFAKSIANRYWKHFMGRGLVEPEDDMRITNPPTNPELLDALSEELKNSGFDVKRLIKTICLSSTYQLSELANQQNLRDSTCYSRYYPKRLTAEVLLDAIDDVLGKRTNFDNMPPGTRATELPDTSFASYFLTVFGRPDSATSCECERTTSSNLAQSLHLMNSKEMHTKLSDSENRLTQWVNAHAGKKESSSVTDLESNRKIAEDNIVDLYLHAFGRKPTESEQIAAVQYLMGRLDRLREAYEDLAWSIINSKEFLFNH